MTSEQALIAIKDNLKAWQSLLATEPKSDAVRFGKMCLRKGARESCPNFVYTAMIAFNIIKQGEGYELSAAEKADYQAYLDRVAPACQRPKRCLEAEVLTEQSEEVRLQMMQNPSFNFDANFTSSMRTSPNAPAQCHLSYVSHMFGIYALIGGPGSSGAAQKDWATKTAASYSDWFVRKNLDLRLEGWVPHHKISRAGNSYSVGSTSPDTMARTETIRRYCTPEVFQ